MILNFFKSYLYDTGGILLLILMASAILLPLLILGAALVGLASRRTALLAYLQADRHLQALRHALWRALPAGKGHPH